MVVSRGWLESWSLGYAEPGDLEDTSVETYHGVGWPMLSFVQQQQRENAFWSSRKIFVNFSLVKRKDWFLRIVYCC